MGRRVVTYEQVLDAAERLFHATGRLETAELAEAVCVSRATLYRVIGSRDHVLGDVLWRQGSRLLSRVVAGAGGSGVERLVAILERFCAELLSYAPLRTLVREDPATALRVLLLPGAAVHSRFVERWQELLEQAEASGDVALPLAAPDAAFLSVRLVESVLYSDLLDAREPDLALAAHAHRALLRAPVAAQGP